MKEVIIYPSRDTEVFDKWEKVIYMAATLVFIANTFIQLLRNHWVMGILWLVLAVLYASFFLVKRIPFAQDRVYYMVNSERIAIKPNLFSRKKELALSDVEKMKIETHGVLFYLKNGAQRSFRFNHLIYDDFVRFRDAIVENGKESKIVLA